MILIICWFSIMRSGRDAKVFLAAEVMEESALGHAGGGADVVHRGRGVALGANRITRGGEELGFGFACVSGQHL